MTFRSRTGLRCHVRADRDATTLGKEQQTVLFRIFQEALTNVVRHARASAVEVTLAERPHIFELRIRDNGGGITDQQIRDPRSIGLLGMGRRGKGTVVTVRVPLTAAAQTPEGGQRRPSGRRQPR
jgi:signal transduction histidine kinase